MPKVELITADVEVLRDAAVRLREHDETVLAQRLEVLADYANTVIRQAVKAEAGERRYLYGAEPLSWDEEEVTPSDQA